MKQTTLFFAGLALLAASCAKTEVISNGAQDNGKGIGFSAYTARHTKAAQEDVTTETLNSFNVTALKHGADDKYIDNVSFSKNGNVWESSNKYFWPNYALDFYAYNTPGGNTTFTPSFTSASQTIAVTPATELANQEDLVAAKAENKTFANANVNGAIDLEFNHYLTQIVVQAKNSNTTNYQVEVKGAKIARLAGDGTYTFGTGNMVATDGKVNSDASTSYTTTFSTAKILTAEAQEVMTEGSEGKGRWYLIPQNVRPWAQATNKTNVGEEGTNYGTYLALNVKITASDGTHVIYPATGDYAWMAVPISTEASFDLAQGKKYTFILNFFSNNQGAGYVDPEDPGDLDGDGSADDDKGEAITASVIKFSAEVINWDETNTQVNINL
ncbi:MAG: fimbrillin family protein [Candidatus Cryptobacteroides sp.]